MGKAVHRILIIKLRAVGDVVMATAALPSLRKAYPEAEIHFMTEKACRPVLEGNPLIDRILDVPPDPWGNPFQPESWLAFFRFIRRFRNQRYDLVLDLFGNPRSAWLSLLSRGRVRVGFDFRGRKLAYNKRISPRGDRIHEVEFNLDAVRALGIPVVRPEPMFPFSKTDADAMERWLNENRLNGRFLAALHVWGSWPAKRWGIRKFADLADRLAERYGAKIILLWGPGEKTHAEAVQKIARCETVLAPRTTLKQLGALLSLCGLVVANDSGPMHIAAAVGTPTVGIFGPTNWKLQGPYGKKSAAVYKRDLSCLGCNKLECGDRTCMETLGVEEVMEAVGKVIGRRMKKV